MNVNIQLIGIRLVPLEKNEVARNKCYAYHKKNTKELMPQ